MNYNPSNGASCEHSKIVGAKSDHLHEWEMIDGGNISTYEYCSRCGLRERFFKADNKRYLKTHKRDFLQPTGATARLFAREYGEPNYEADKNQGKADDGLD